jgi:hypothetical protein
MSTETLPVLTRDNLRERCGGAWSYVSASRLNLWLKCPLAFRLKYVDGVALPMSPAQFIGRRVHEGLEVFYRHRQIGVTLQPHEVIERMQTVWPAAIEADAMKFTDAAAERNLVKTKTP